MEIKVNEKLVKAAIADMPWLRDNCDGAGKSIASWLVIRQAGNLSNEDRDYYIVRVRAEVMATKAYNYLIWGKY